MESGPAVSIFIAGLVFSFLLSALYSIVKIVFSAIIDGANPAEGDETLRYYASQSQQILENKSLLNSTVSIGRTFGAAGFTLFSYLLFCRFFPGISFLQSIGISVFFSFVVISLLSYEIPRAFAMRYFRSYFPFIYTCYKMFGWFFTPFSTLFLAIHRSILKALRYDEKFSFLSDKEKARIVEQNDTEALDDEEKEMIRSIFDLGDTTVREIMVPRIDIQGLPVESNLQSVLKIVQQEGHSRIPVFKETIDSIIGILYSKDILSWLAENDPENWDLKKLLNKPHYVPVGKKVNDLMREFKRKHIHLAIVVDEYGGTAGLITMEDILEEIVGDIQDEYDEEEKEVVKIADNVYLIDPHIDIYDLNEELGTNLETEDVEYNTLGGLVYHEYGDVPLENTEFDYNGLRITVVKMDNQRIEKVKVEILQKPANSIEIDSF